MCGRGAITVNRISTSRKMSILVSGGRLRAADRSLELHTNDEPSRRLKFNNHGEGPYHRVYGLLLVERHYDEWALTHSE